MSRFAIRSLAVPVALVAVFTACSRSDAPPADSAAAAAAAGNAKAVPLVGSAAPAPQARAMPGALTKPLANYTGDEFYQLVQGQNYVGAHQQQRKCKNDPGCGTTRRTAVTVAAIATQDSISPATVPQFGVVYVRALNMGDAEEARYNLLPFKDRYQYFLIITADASGNKMNWTMEQLDLTPTARKHTTVGTGKFETCAGHSWQAGAQANFKTCQQAAAAHDSVVHLGLALQGEDDPPVWASCAGGCCIGNGA